MGLVVKERDLNHNCVLVNLQFVSGHDSVGTHESFAYGGRPHEILASLRLATGATERPEKAKIAAQDGSHLAAGPLFAGFL